MIFILFGLITGLLLISIVAYDRDMTAPCVLLVAAFWIASFCACLYADKWQFENYLLIAVVMSGLCGFFLFSWGTYALSRKRKNTVKRQLVPLEISNFKLVLYLLFQLVLYLLTFLVMLKNVGIDFSLSRLASIVGTYYEMNHTGSIIYTSSIVNIGTIINFPGMYYILYLPINNILQKKRNSSLLYINIVIGAIGSLMSGTKTAFYMYIIGAFVMIFILVCKSNGWRKNINFKVIIRVSVILVIVLASFTVIDNMQGRTLTDVSAVDKLAAYLGSPLKNLELFISENHKTDQIFGAETFISIYNDLYEITGNGIFKIKNMYKYRWINGNGLGNVYTVFMPIYYDFGILGVFVVMGIIGWFSQRVYNRIKFRRIIFDVDYYVIFYAYVAFAVVFSFFSNKFFETIFSKTGVYFLIGMWMFDLFFMRFNIRDMKIKFNRRKYEGRGGWNGK